MELSKKYKVLMALVGASVAVLIISNLASTKITQVGPAVFDAGTILFPIAYIITSIITEVYGPKVARFSVMIGLASIAAMSLVLLLVQYLPVGPGFENQAAYESILGFVPRIALASMIAYFVGETVNIRLVGWIKQRFGKKRLLARILGSSSTGELLDTVVFSVIAFAGVVPAFDLLNIIVTVFLIKFGFDLILSPLSVRLIAWMKTREVRA